MSIHQVPCLRILLPFIAGIILGWMFINNILALLFAITGLAVWLIALLKERDHLYNSRHIKGIAISLLFIAAGIGVYNNALPPVYDKEQADKHNILEIKALQTRERLIDTYRHYVDDENIPILSAITLGKKDEISKETKSNFSLSGGSHVLAVSGLHVGIIYMILLWLTSLLPYRRWIFVTAHIVVIACLWIYAFICGLPASVVRSSLMFSLVSGAFIVERQNLSLNSVFVSAFIMLLYNPLYLFNIGFQLSYSAVISILLFYPKISALFTFNNKILVWVWSMIAVSAAAQIGTLPLTLYYFHQMPVYSLVTNFLVIPAAFFLIYTGASLLALNWWNAVAEWIGRIIDFLTTMLQDGVRTIVELPYSVIRDIHIEPWLVAGLYAIILSIWFFIDTKRARFLHTSLIFVICLQIIDIKMIIFAS